MSKVPYASAIESLIYTTVYTRQDIAYVVGVVSNYMSNPGKQHWEAVKWIMRYLRGTSYMSLCFTSVDLKLQGYVDANLVSDVGSRKSITGFVYTLGGTVVCWTSRLQKIVALSITEVEYAAMTEARKKMVWLQGFLDELGKTNEKGVLHSESQNAIFLAKNPAYHSSAKRI